MRVNVLRSTASSKCNVNKPVSRSKSKLERVGSVVSSMILLALTTTALASLPTVSSIAPSATLTYVLLTLLPNGACLIESRSEPESVISNETLAPDGRVPVVRATGVTSRVESF